MTERENVILVDENDCEIGLMEKMEAHVKGVLHRAFSVFVFNNDGDLIIQQRAYSKYHSPGIWANTCCSHPRQGEKVIDAAHRRLKEEMGFDTELKEVFSFLYKADVGQGLIEHELDHVIIGVYNESPKINDQEVASWKALPVQEIRDLIKINPEQYAEWFKIAFEQVSLHGEINL